jgi:hypothetical protein
MNAKSKDTKKDKKINKKESEELKETLLSTATNKNKAGNLSTQGKDKGGKANANSMFKKNKKDSSDSSSSSSSSDEDSKNVAKKPAAKVST